MYLRHKITEIKAVKLFGLGMASPSFATVANQSLNA